MATTGYSSANHHSVVDHADLTAPNSDWFRLCICRPDSAMASGADIVSTAEYGIANSFNIYAFDNTFGLKVNALGDLNFTYSNGTWYLLCAQRSGTALSFRGVAMGTTTVLSDSGGTLSSAVDATTTMRIGRRSDTGANPFDGAISDVMFVNGQTISDADLQNIATGTAIDSFAWYSSRVFWGILENQTALDQTGDHTITEEGTLSTAADPVQLVRFGDITVVVNQSIETDSAFGITWIKSLAFALSSETDTGQSFNSSKTVTTSLASETDTAQVVTPQLANLVNVIQASETDSAQIMTPHFPIILMGLSSETNTALQLESQRSFILAQSLETDIAFSNSPTKFADVNLSSEVDSAFSSDFFKIFSLGFAIETDTAIQISRIGGLIDVLNVDNLGVKIIIDDKIKTSSLSATSTATGFSVNNIKLDNKYQIWRSTSLTTQVITATWVTPELLGGVGLAFNNLIVGSTMRIKLFANSGDSQAIAQTPVLTVDFTYDPPHGFDSIGYISFPFGGGNYFSCFFNETSVGKLEITLTSAGNPDGSMEIARLVSGPIISLDSRPDYGASVSQIDRTLNSRADGGDPVSNRGTQSKELKLPLAKLTRGDALLYNTIMRAVKRNVPIYVSVVGDNFTDEDIVSYQIYGQRDKNLALSRISHNRSSSNMTLTEI